MTLEDGSEVATPIAEVKNLNSFRAIKGAIEYESKRQVEQWKKDGVEMGPGRKATFGWDPEKCGRSCSVPKRMPTITAISPSLIWSHSEWTKHGANKCSRLPELPQARRQRYTGEYGLPKKTPRLWSPIPTSASSTRMPSKTPHPKQPTPRRNCC